MGSVSNFVNRILFKNRNVPVQAFQAWKVPYKCLFYFRWCACIYGILLTIDVWYGEWPQVQRPLYFMTTWGELMVTIYFILITACVYSYRGDPDSVIYGGPLWKTTKIFCQVAYSFEFLIFVFYWSLLSADDISNINKRPEPRRTFGIVNDVLLHAVMPLLITLEVIFNMIQFQTRQGLLIDAIVGLVYMLVNFLVTKLTGQPVYPPLSWDSLYTLLYSVMGAVLAVAGFFIGYFLQKWKVKKADEKFRDTQLLPSKGSSERDSEKYYGMDDE